MKMNFEELLTQVTGFMKDEARTQTIIGEQFKLGDFSCVPVIRVGMGFGSGLGEGDAVKAGHGEGGGLGAGMGIEPIGFLVAHGPDITFIPSRTTQGLAKAFEKAPELLEKFLESRAKMEEPVLS